MVQFILALLMDLDSFIGGGSLIHLTPDVEADFASGVTPGTFFARLGDVSEMTVPEYQVNVVGRTAAAGPTQSVSGFVTAVQVLPEASRRRV